MRRTSGQEDAVGKSPFVEQGNLFPDKALFTFHQENKSPERLSGHEFNQKVFALGGVLQQALAPHESVLLLLPQGLDFIYSLIACWFANVVAVPFALTDLSAPERMAEKVLALVSDCQAACILTDKAVSDALGSMPAFQSVPWMDVKAASAGAVAGTRARPQAPGDTALLLYTSGSTSRPKAVMLSHANLIAQARMAAAQWRIDDQSRIVSWAPLYHSFGLIVGLLAPLIKGAAGTLMPPGDFIKNPETWLRRLDQYAATHTGAPNFALDLCCAAIDPAQVGGLSVGALEAIICGGEPIRKQTWETFVRTFGHIGFRETQFCPNFGLSETGSVAFKQAGRPPRFLFLDAAGLADRRVIVSPKAKNSRCVTSCGEIGQGIRALAVHPDTCVPCGPSRIGEIWVKSPGVASGYLNCAAESAQIFSGILAGTKENGFFRTGDLGFIQDSHLYIIGREKEMIVIAGKNYHPVDIEWTIREMSSDSNLPVAVISRRIDGQERVIVVQEVDETLDAAAFGKIARRIRGCVSERHGLALDEVILVPEKSIPKSGGGKIQRRWCRQAYEDKRLKILHACRQNDPAARSEAGRPPAGIAAVLKDRAFLPECPAAGQLDTDTRFAELGLSSLQYMRIAGRIEALFDIRFSPVMFFKYRRFGQLARYIAGLTAKQDDGRAGRPPGEFMGFPDAGRRAAVPNDVAIIGIACNFPGGARDAETFWENIIAGKDAVASIAQSRPGILQDARRYGAAVGRGFPEWGGFIDGADTFDADFFGISPLEAESMDPQQRKLLELVWEVMERSGYPARGMAGEKIGVFVGAHNTDYAELVHRHPGLVEVYGAFLDSGLHMSLLPHRVSRMFDFRGPSELINSACSSSLVAVHHAAASVRNGQSRLAIACGINLMFTSRVYLMALKAGMLARDGRCKTFDAAADGFARAEGYGAVVIKPLHRAVRDNDTIYGIIKGSAINHDGQSNSLRAPNLVGQKSLIQDAWRAAGISPETIGYIETHGTGTGLGDPVEIQALLEAYRETAPDPPAAFCGLGSVKTHMGHAESAAGMAGLIQVLMALKHRTLPGMLHFKEPNPWIRLSPGPFFISARKREWRRLSRPDGSEMPRRAGVSSFGFGGANAHVIVEEYTACEAVKSAPAEEDVSAVIVLSAMNKAGLRAYADRLRSYVSKFGRSVRLRDLAYTLQVGREAMAARAAFRVNDLSELNAQLGRLAQNGGSPAPLGAAGPENRAVQAARSWLQGRT
ncbi:MAG: AMP-binding protein, partial [Desulfatitalea sp.]|nr:AMP-binding protein [Desulfatitalea sp.]